MSNRDVHEHQGVFAEGQAREEHHPEAEAQGDFGTRQAVPTERHEGSFADGQARDEHHPERDHHGRFAQGDGSGGDA